MHQLNGFVSLPWRVTVWLRLIGSWNLAAYLKHYVGKTAKLSSSIKCLRYVLNKFGCDSVVACNPGIHRYYLICY